MMRAQRFLTSLHHSCSPWVDELKELTHGAHGPVQRRLLRQSSWRVVWNPIISTVSVKRSAR